MLLFLTSGSDSISGSDFYLCQSIKRRDYLGGSRTPHCSATSPRHTDNYLSAMHNHYQSDYDFSDI